MLLGVSLAGQAGGGHHGSSAVVAAWVAGSLLVAALAVGPGLKSLAGGAGFGIAAGVLYAAGDVAAKGGGSEERGVVVFVAAVLACHGLAFVSLQLGFQRGNPLSTVGLSSLLTNAVPIVAGMGVSGEGLPGGALGAARLLGVLLRCRRRGPARPAGRGSEAGIDRAEEPERALEPRSEDGREEQ